MKRLLVFAVSVLFAAALRSQSPVEKIPVHDPVMIKQGGMYYLFATGMGIAVWSSPDLVTWKAEKPVFAAPPEWAIQEVPTFKGHIWAPDISHHDGQYYLYYSISAFGKNTSCIGLATATTLDPKDPGYGWRDHGKIIESIPGVTNWNAIDPNLVTDDRGTPFLTFGSFWDGLKIVQLTPDRTRLAEKPEALLTLASRKTRPSEENPPAVAGNPADAGGNAIEAPFVFKRDGRYYLFASIDYCCKGRESDYKMIVGRADDVRGPYLDKEGKRMDRGGGTILLTGDEHWYGVGHNAVYTFDGVDYLIFHGYDASDPKGRAKLRIERLSWDEAGWPVVQLGQ